MLTMSTVQIAITVVAVLALGAAAAAVFALGGEQKPPAVVLGAPGETPAGHSPTAEASREPVEAPVAEVTPTALPDRTDCDEIRGTEYRSEAERAFFLENCLGAATADPQDPAVTLAPSSAAEDCETSVEVQLSRSDATYDVAGLTLDEIAASLDTSAPQIEAGTAYGLTEYTYGIEGAFCLDAAGACGLGEIAVAADVIVTLPRLTTIEQLSSEVAAVWTSYYDMVSIHEGRHARILEDGLQEMRRLLLLIPPQPDCDSLDHEIDKAWALASGQIEQRQRAFHVADAQGGGGLVVQ